MGAGRKLSGADPEIKKRGSDYKNINVGVNQLKR